MSIGELHGVGANLQTIAIKTSQVLRAPADQRRPKSDLEMLGHEILQVAELLLSELARTDQNSRLGK